MRLAGEAGSLLKIEEEIRDAVAAAKKQYAKETTQAIDRKGRPLFFTEAEMGRVVGGPKQESLFDVSDITDATFFENAEKRVVETLRSYAETAGLHARLQRQLFAEDAVRGFAFVDLCQKRYDAVLMNPPFGDGTSNTHAYLSLSSAASANDLYAAFVERGHGVLCHSRLAPASFSHLSATGVTRCYSRSLE